MNIKIKCLALLCFLTPSLTHAANNIMSARGNGMAGTGVAVADLVSSGFYNPALAAMQTDQTFVVLLPSLGIEVEDDTKLIRDLEDFDNQFQSYLNGAFSAAQAADTLHHLKNKLAYIHGGMAGAVAVNKGDLGGSLFIQGFSELVTISDIRDQDIDALLNGGNPTALASKGSVLSFGMLELGLSFAKKVRFFEHDIAIGITPKLQKLLTNYYETSILHFRFDDWDSGSNHTKKSTVNFDFGAAWQQGSYQVGFSVLNMIPYHINTADQMQMYQYKITPLVSLGFGYHIPLFTFAVDLDLTKQKGFTHIHDDAQYLRLGGEVNLFDWLQTRAGYKVNLENSLDNAFSLGGGISAFNTFHIDIAGEYSRKNQFGLSLQLIFNY